MDALSAQLKQIVEQLRTMSVSQRIAVGLLLVVVLGGMWGMIRWGAEGEWMPLHPQSFTPEQIQRIRSELTAVGIPSSVENDRIMIRGDEARRQQLVAMLAEHGAMPRDTSIGYAALIRENSVFMGDRSRMWMEHRGLESELSAVLRHFQGVRDAHVFIEVPQQRGFSNKSGGSRASVHVKLADGEVLDKHRVGAIANFVIGAVSGLEMKNVKITDGIRFYRVPDSSDELPTELLDIQRQAEEHAARKIYDQLQYIRGVLVNVHAALRDAEEQIQEKKLGPAVVDQEKTRSEEMTGPGPAAGPGVRPNQGRLLAESGGASSSAKEETETSLRGERDAKMQTIVKRAGPVERLSASVNVPRSYLVQILAGRGEKAAPADDKEVEKIAAVELPKIRDQVRPLVSATSDEQVVVNWYHDAPMEEHRAAAQTQPAGAAALFRQYGPQAGLGALAVVSLVMMVWIARRAQPTPGPKLAGAGAGMSWSAGRGRYETGDESNGPLQRLGGGPATVGEAEEMESVMVGQEIDEATVRTQQMVKQIGQMIREDPATASTIIQHWMSERE